MHAMCCRRLFLSKPHKTFSATTRRGRSSLFRAQSVGRFTLPAGFALMGHASMARSPGIPTTADRGAHAARHGAHAQEAGPLVRQLSAARSDRLARRGARHLLDPLSQLAPEWSTSNWTACPKISHGRASARCCSAPNAACLAP